MRIDNQSLRRRRGQSVFRSQEIGIACDLYGWDGHSDGDLDQVWRKVARRDKLALVTQGDLDLEDLCKEGSTEA